MDVWIAIGISCALVLSLPVGLVVAAILGAIGRSVSQLLEAELWASTPLAQDDFAVEKAAG